MVRPGQADLIFWREEQVQLLAGKTLSVRAWVHTTTSGSPKEWQAEKVSWLQRILGLGRPPLRSSGRPTSANRASSMHLLWDVPPELLRSVEVTLTVTDPPLVPELYFWALQVDFIDGPGRTGGGHLGLQHHPRYPGSCAANWGGYHSDGGELDGEMFLPSSLGNPNTCDFGWRRAVPYRLRIEPAPGRGWRGSVTDRSTGETTVIRDLHGGGTALVAPMVWSEVFAPCDAPSAAVKWTDPVVETMAGDVVVVKSARVNYQTEREGGCSNTTVEHVSGGVVQRTSAQRTIPAGATVKFAGI